MREVTQHGSGERNFLEWWTVDFNDVSVLSSSSLWPSLIPAAWRITFKTLASPESWSVHQSSAWHSSSSLCPPHLRLPRVLIPLTPHGWPQGRWFLCPLFGSLFLRFKSRSLCWLKSILSTQRLIRTELVSLGDRGRRQKGNGKACSHHYYCHFSGQQNFFYTLHGALGSEMYSLYSIVLSTVDTYMPSYLSRGMFVALSVAIVITHRENYFVSKIELFCKWGIWNLSMLVILNMWT